MGWDEAGGGRYEEVEVKGKGRRREGEGNNRMKGEGEQEEGLSELRNGGKMWVLWVNEGAEGLEWIVR